jgi:hypothetical protein
MSRAATHTQAEIERAVKAVQNVFGDNSVAAVEITAAGALRVLIGSPASTPVADGDGANEWDEVLGAA